MRPTALKYLRRHGEPEAQRPPSLSQNYGHVVVIPVYGEDDSLWETLESIPSGPLGKVLKIVVVNGRADSPLPVHERNRRHLNRLAQLPDLILIDRASPTHYLPPGQGVGLARKIGCDVALALFLSGRIASPWIHCTDADTLLPSDYFHRSTALEGDPKIAAWIYPFHHLCEEDGQTAEAMRLYEISLRYYVLGLNRGASPYAYPSLGSSLAVHGEAYAQIGGFPRRSAGEDFYLLNKAAKVGRIVLMAGKPLLIRGRLSSRVPFGTGKALHKILEDKLVGRPFKLYHPRIFDYLAAWLKTLQSWAFAEDGTIHELLERSCRPFPHLDFHFLEERLKSLGAFSALEKKLPPSSRPEVRLRHAHTWWDAFRTLKFIHTLRETRYTSLPFSEALSQADFLDAGAYLPEKNWEGLRLHLALAEGEVLRQSKGVAR